MGVADARARRVVMTLTVLVLVVVVVGEGVVGMVMVLLVVACMVGLVTASVVVGGVVVVMVGLGGRARHCPLCRCARPVASVRSLPRTTRSHTATQPHHGLAVVVVVVTWVGDVVLLVCRGRCVGRPPSRPVG